MAEIESEKNQIESSSEKVNSNDEKTTVKRLQSEIVINENVSPKKMRLDPEVVAMVSGTSKIESSKNPKRSQKQFNYGNYSRYYGYRCEKNTEDGRLVALREHLNLFKDKDCLDIGCNDGTFTLAVAQSLSVKSIIGIDIDKDLIFTARKQRRYLRKTSNNNETSESKASSVDIKFDHCNYVLRDDRLLDLEKPQFDTILMLSVSKWIHLNFGDDGLKRVFNRIYRQLRPGGRFIFEPQEWHGYKARKNLTPTMRQNYDSTKFFPNKFDEYLLSDEIGFTRFDEIQLPKHSKKGFQRALKVFCKSE